jgi:hypothetical protein
MKKKFKNTSSIFRIYSGDLKEPANQLVGNPHRRL